VIPAAPPVPGVAADNPVATPLDGSIYISITNNGDARISAQQGVGSLMLDEVTMNWSRELTDSGVQVLAKVALS
jgi:hypothetical protein